MSRRWVKVDTRKVQGSTNPELFDYLICAPLNALPILSQKNVLIEQSWMLFGAKFYHWHDLGALDPLVLAIGFGPATQILGQFGPSKKRINFGMLKTNQKCVLIYLNTYILTPNHNHNKVLLPYCVLFNRLSCEHIFRHLFCSLSFCYEIFWSSSFFGPPINVFGPPSMLHALVNFKYRAWSC